MGNTDKRTAPDVLSHETDGSQGIDSWTSCGYGVSISSQNTPEQQKAIDQINSDMDYAQALAIARSKKARINYCTEYNNAYVFSYDTGEHSKGGDSPIVIMKDTGAALNFISYAVKDGNEIVREFKVK